MLTKSNFHTKYITTGVIRSIIICSFIISLAFSLGNVITFSLDGTSTAVRMLHLFQFVTVISVILSTSCLNLYLYYFVKRTSQQIAAKETIESYSSRLTTTIALLVWLYVTDQKS